MYNLETIIEENIAKALNSAADSYKNKGELKMSKKLYLEALKLREALSKIDKTYYQPLVAETFNSLALVCKEANEYDLAIRYYKKSIFSIRKLFKNDLRYTSLLAVKYTDIANLYRRDYKYAQAEFFYNQALKTYKELPKEDFDKSQIKILNIYNYLSIICNEKNKFQETRESYLGALKIYQNLVNESSQKYQPELAMTLYSLADLYFKNNRENKAGEVYILALEILLYLEQKEPKKYKETLALTFHHLAQIYTTQHEYPDALSAYRESLNHYIELAEEEPTKYGPKVAILFKNLASFYKEQNKKDLAEYFYLRLVELYGELHHYNESAYGLKLASSIIDGVTYYHQHTLTLYQAESIINGCKDNIQVDELSEKIYCLRQERSPVS